MFEFTARSRSNSKGYSERCGFVIFGISSSSTCGGFIVPCGKSIIWHWKGLWQLHLLQITKWRFVEACLEEAVVVYIDHLLTQKNYIKEKTIERMRVDEEVFLDFFREYINWKSILAQQLVETIGSLFWLPWLKWWAEKIVFPNSTWQDMPCFGVKLTVYCKKAKNHKLQNGNGSSNYWRNNYTP